MRKGIRPVRRYSYWYSPWWVYRLPPASRFGWSYQFYQDEYLTKRIKLLTRRHLTIVSVECSFVVQQLVHGLGVDAHPRHEIFAASSSPFQVWCNPWRDPVLRTSCEDQLIDCQWITSSHEFTTHCAEKETFWWLNDNSGGYVADTEFYGMVYIFMTWKAKELEGAPSFDLKSRKSAYLGGMNNQSRSRWYHKSLW